MFDLAAGIKHNGGSALLGISVLHPSEIAFYAYALTVIHMLFGMVKVKSVDAGDGKCARGNAEGDFRHCL